MITFSCISKIGGRDVNEDSIFTYGADDRYLFALADGLGGHGYGEVASKIAIEKCAEVFLAKGRLDECFWSVQNCLLEEQRRLATPNDMKTTLALLCVERDKVCWGHVGDSRIYHFSMGKLATRTLDHSVPQMLVATGDIREKAIRRHEDRNRLLRVLGMEWDNPKFELSDGVALVRGDSFLLCSDGFWEWVVEKQMLRFLKRSETPEQWLLLMEEETLKNGKGKNMDNYSAIAVYVR